MVFIMTFSYVYIIYFDHFHHLFALSSPPTLLLLFYYIFNQYQFHFMSYLLLFILDFEYERKHVTFVFLSLLHSTTISCYSSLYLTNTPLWIYTHILLFIHSSVDWHIGWFSNSTSLNMYHDKHRYAGVSIVC
jgi:hypothetical protein